MNFVKRMVSNQRLIKETWYKIKKFHEEMCFMGKDFLSYEEQFKEVLNNEEIDRIENRELREIRMKYWRLQRDAFIDENNISDQELNKVSQELTRKEMEEIQRFRNKK